MRSRTMTAVAVAVTAIALALAGCSGSTPPSEHPEGSPTPIRTGVPTEQPSDVPTTGPTAASASNVGYDTSKVSTTLACPRDDPREAFDGGTAVEAFGQEAVMDAFCETAGFYIKEGTWNFRAKKKWREADFAEVDKRVGPLLRDDYNKSLRKFLKDPDTTELPITVGNVNIRRWGYEFPAGGLRSIGNSVGPATAALATQDGQEFINFRFTAYTNFAVNKVSDPVNEYLLGVPTELVVSVHPNPNKSAGTNLEWVIKAADLKWGGTGPVPLEDFFANPEVLKE